MSVGDLGVPTNEERSTGRKRGCSGIGQKANQTRQSASFSLLDGGVCSCPGEEALSEAPMISGGDWVKNDAKEAAS